MCLTTGCTRSSGFGHVTCCSRCSDSNGLMHTTRCHRKYSAASATATQPTGTMAQAHTMGQTSTASTATATVITTAPEATGTPATAEHPAEHPSTLAAGEQLHTQGRPGAGQHILDELD